VSRWIPSNLNVDCGDATIAPGEVKRDGKLIEVREPRTISLVLDVLICISSLAVQVSREVRCDDILLTETSRWNQFRECGMVYKFVHFTGSSEVVNEDYKRQETESRPPRHTDAKCLPGGKELTDPNVG